MNRQTDKAADATVGRTVKQMAELCLRDRLPIYLGRLQGNNMKFFH